MIYCFFFKFQKYILELISDLFRLPLPDWTDDFHAALLSVGECTVSSIFCEFLEWIVLFSPFSSLIHTCALFAVEHSCTVLRRITVFQRSVCGLLVSPAHGGQLYHLPSISTLCPHYDIVTRSVFISFTSIANNNEYNNKGVLAAAILVLSRDSWRGKEEKKRGGEGGRRVCGEGKKKE